MIAITPRTVKTDGEPSFIEQSRDLARRKKRAAEHIEQAVTRWERRQRLLSAAEATK